MANRNEHSKHPSATKRGPGRYHSDGHSKATPIPPRGAVGMVLHAASKEKKHRRDLVRQVGRRQAIKLLKTERAIARDWLVVPDDVEAPVIA